MLDNAFVHDTEFQKLLVRRSDVDLTRAALEIARDADPLLDFTPTVDWMSDRAAELAGPVARASSDRAVLAAFVECLSDRCGLTGDESCYSTAESSYLPHVIESRRGIPISLSLVYMGVAKRLGLPLEGVGAPMHFLTRYDGITGPLFLDAFSGGEVMTYDECFDWIQSLVAKSGNHLPPHAAEGILRPVNPRAIVIRMLNNLKVVHARNEDWKAAWTVQHRLTMLQPSVYEERRNLALVAIRSQSPGRALELLESCIKSCPDEDRRILEAHIAEARRRLTQSN